MSQGGSPAAKRAFMLSFLAVLLGAALASMSPTQEQRVALVGVGGSATQHQHLRLVPVEGEEMGPQKYNPASFVSTNRAI